jgi:hypothetical protein
VVRIIGRVHFELCRYLAGGDRVDDLRARAQAFIRGPCVLSEPWSLIHRYIAGELWDDPDAQNLLSRGLQTAQTEAAHLEGATSGPARDARLFFQEAAEFLKDIMAELSARKQ